MLPLLFIGGIAIAVGGSKAIGFLLDWRIEQDREEFPEEAVEA